MLAKHNQHAGRLNLRGSGLPRTKLAVNMTKNEPSTAVTQTEAQHKHTLEAASARFGVMPLRFTKGAAPRAHCWIE